MGPGPHCSMDPWPGQLNPAPLWQDRGCSACSSSTSASTKRRISSPRTHSTHPVTTGTIKAKSAVLLRRCAPRERAALRHRQMESGTRTRGAIPVAAGLECEPGLAVITEALTRNGKIPAPTTPGSPGGTAAASRCCFAQLFPQTRKASFDLQCHQTALLPTHRPSGRRRSSSPFPWPITRINCSEVPGRSGHLPSELVGQGPVIGRALPRAPPSGRSASTAFAPTQRFARFQPRWRGPRTFQSFTRCGLASPGANTPGSTGGDHQRARLERPSDRSY